MTLPQVCACGYGVNVISPITFPKLFSVLRVEPDLNFNSRRCPPVFREECTEKKKKLQLSSVSFSTALTMLFLDR